MTTTATIVELGPRDGPEPDHTGVVPAIEAGADPIDAFVSASPTSSERNQNMTAEEALGQLEQVGAAGRDASRAARAVGRRRRRRRPRATRPRVDARAGG